MSDAAPRAWPSADGHRLVFAVEFDASTLSQTRQQVSRAAGQCGMPGAQIDDFAIAVNEIMTNAVRHGGGCGRIRLWRTTAGLGCEISDAGPGGPPERFNGHRLPPTTATGGRGLWLARHLCDTFGVDSGGTGTTVRMTMTI